MIKAEAVKREQLHPTTSAQDFGFPGNPLAEGTKGGLACQGAAGGERSEGDLGKDLSASSASPELPRNLVSRFAACLLPNSIPDLEMLFG